MSTDKKPNPVVEMWKSMMRGGVSSAHIRQQALHNLAGVKDLPDSVEDKQQAIEDVELFITEIDVGKYD